MPKEQTYLTDEGFQSLEKELEQLRSVRRPQIASQIQASKELGAMGENAEYEEAMNELAFLEGRIQELEGLLHNVVMIPAPTKGRAKSGIIQLGSTVRVATSGSKRPSTYTIVGSAEASPAEGRISNESPIGKALMGKAKGDEVDFTVPSGVQHLKVIIQNILTVEL